MRIFAGALFALTAWAQSPGVLLVATPATRDTDFERTVIVLVEQDAHRATGLVLNRPAKIRLCEVFPDLSAPNVRNQAVWAGGPIFIGMNALLRSKTRAPGGEKLVPGVLLISGRAQIRAQLASDTQLDSIRVYLGVCGWGAGQMESEIGRGLWRVLPGSAEAIFDAQPDSLWTRLTRTAAHRDH